MDREQRSQRDAAAKAFFDSLGQLEETLQVPDSGSTKEQLPSGNTNPSQPETQKKAPFTLTELEAAAADIEEYFQSLQAESAQSKD